MRWDFWNNPLVVSAFRVRTRRVNPVWALTLYLMVLVSIGAGIYFYSLRAPAAQANWPWPRIYLGVIFGTQLAVSCFGALQSTHTSMRREVTTRTLDFQRTTGLSPREILWGKLLGEPAWAYLLAMASVPLGVFCWSLGATTLPVLLLMYVSVMASSLLVGAIGLMQPLEIKGDASAAKNSSAAGVLALFGFGMYAMFGMTAGALQTNNQLLAAVPGLWTPLLAVVGVTRGTPWEYYFDFFGIQIPYLFVTPVVQLTLVMLILRAMQRQLVFPLLPTLSKGETYAILAGFDVRVAAMIYHEAVALGSLQAQLATFAAIHLVASVLMIWTTTPNRECLVSWVWRFQGRRPAVADALFGERSSNSTATVGYAVVGLAFAVALVMAPNVGRMPGDWSTAGPQSAAILATMALLILSFGSTHQWSVLAAPTGGWMLPIIIFLVLLLPTFIAGAYYESDPVLSTTPLAHFVNWISPARDLWWSPIPLIYGGLWLATLKRTRTSLARGRANVDSTLAAMGVGQNAENATPEAISSAVPASTSGQ